MKYDSVKSLEMALEYSIRYTELVARLYKKCAVVLAIAELLFGAATVVSAVGEKTPAAIWLGIVTAVVLALTHGWRPGETSAEKRAEAREYYALQKRMPNLNLEQANAEYADINSDATDQVEGLRWVALNDMHIKFNHPDRVRDLTRWQKILKTLA